MKRIPAGCFLMGNPTHLGRGDGERQHEVCVREFEIGVYEVTQGQWQAVMGDNPSNFQSCGVNCPVESVSWNDVQDYLRELNRRAGKRYRLPTEAEWEYACRGGEEGQTYCGATGTVDRVAWYSGNSGDQTHPVGQKMSNGFGLYDMSGNVAEWTCSMMWEMIDNVYVGEEQKCTNIGTDTPRATRGGNWGHEPAGVRSASRYRDRPTSRGGVLGFRLARSL